MSLSQVLGFRLVACMLVAIGTTARIRAVGHRIGTTRPRTRTTTLAPAAPSVSKFNLSLFEWLKSGRSFNHLLCLKECLFFTETHQSSSGSILMNKLRGHGLLKF